MATYREIKGVTIQTLDEDPVANGGSWSSGGDLNSARTTLQSGGTGNDNAIVAGGYNASTPHRTKSESYNGTTWTETAENNDARQFGGGAGTNTNAIIAGGDPSSFYTAAETWNGSAWTEAPNMNTNKNQNAMTGNATAAITIGGGNPGAIDSVESWNGSAWTETSYDLNTAKKYIWATGTTTAALASGTPATTESLDGTTWTEVTESSTDHRSGSASGARDDCIVYGGDNGPGYIGITEQWDGTSWTEVNDLSTGRAYLGGTGSTPNSQTGLAFGGSTPSQTSATEEWGFPPVPQNKLKEGMLFFNTAALSLKGFGQAAGIPSGSWASGANLNTARAYIGPATRGTKDAALGFGGDPNGSDLVESYNGTSWAETTEINTPRAAAAGAGTQDSALASTGFPSTGKDKVESWNGSSWTEKTEPNLPRDSTNGTGASNTSALIFGGYNPPQIYEAETEEWNGSTWTEVSDLNTGRRSGGSAGTATSAMLAGGSIQPGPLNNVETWNGTTWSEIAEINAANSQAGCGSDGTNTSVLRFGGEQPGSPNTTATTEFWNGSSWTELGDMATARYTPGGAGSAANAIGFGGYTNPPAADSALTEEWTAPATLSSVTSS